MAVRGGTQSICEDPRAAGALTPGFARTGWVWRAVIIWLLLCSAPWLYAAGAGLDPITTARGVHELPPDVAAKALPVHLRATVTYYEPGFGLLFLADASGSVFVQIDRPYPVHEGDLVELNGVTDPSLRTRVGVGARIHVIGVGARFPATRTGYQQFMSGELDCQPTSIRGVVRSASLDVAGTDTIAQLQVLLPGGLVQVYINNPAGLDLRALIDSEVEISGVAAAEFNGRLQMMGPMMFSSSKASLKVLRRPEIQPLQLPITDIDRVMANYMVVNESKRIRVRGAVTAFNPGYSMVVQNGDRSLIALTRQLGPLLPLGSVVDVVGFADDHSYSAVLENAQFYPTGQMELVKPVAVSYAGAMTGAYSDTLVEISGRVLSELHDQLSDVVVIMVDSHPVSLVLRREGQESLLTLQPGTLVRVKGICRVTPGTTVRNVLLFRLDLRNRSDVEVLARPSWWNVTHLLITGSGLLGMTALTLGWIAVLRRRVAKQTAQIERSMRVERERSRLLERINSEVPLEELLNDVCASIASLVPGACCLYTLGEEKLSGSGAAPIYEAALTDARGRQVGIFRVQHTGIMPLSAEQRETLVVGASLANLAVNQRRLYDELNYHSTHDQLTSLPNRRLADLRLDNAIVEAARNGTRVGVAYIDVDHFKQVNDRHGHKIGDVYLQQIAGRLGRSVRGSDLLARIGGDEFLLVATRLGGVEDGEAYQRRLADCFESEFMLDGIRMRGSASVGFAMFPDHGSTPEELKRHADTAMYTAKRGVRAATEAAAPKMGRADVFSPADLRSALENDRFRLFYQPQFSSTGRLRGLEALIRMEDPILGMVAPDQFIGIAERSNVIFPLGEWVLRRALADAARWGLGPEDGTRMVVNVSARQVERPGFAETVALALLESGVCAGALEIEITERAAISDTASAACQLATLQAWGVHISIDDFGTEHSSLSVLHKLPIDTLKIDRSFVRAMGSEPEVVRVLDAIVHLGHSLGKRIVAEGVECEQEVRTLLELGEMDFQGYVFSRPVPPDTVQAKLEGWRRQGTSHHARSASAAAAEPGRLGTNRAAAPISDRV